MNAGELYTFLSNYGVTNSDPRPVTITGAGSLAKVEVDVDGTKGPPGGLYLEPPSGSGPSKISAAAARLKIPQKFTIDTTKIKPPPPRSRP